MTDLRLECTWTKGETDPVHLAILDTYGPVTLCRQEISESTGSEYPGWREIALYGICGNCLYVVEVADNYDDCNGCAHCNPAQEMHRCHVTGIINQCIGGG